MEWYVVIYLIIAGVWLLAWSITVSYNKRDYVYQGDFKPERPKTAEETAHSRRWAFISAWWVIATPVWPLVVLVFVITYILKGVWAVIGSAFDFEAVRKKRDKHPTDW